MHTLTGRLRERKARAPSLAASSINQPTPARMCPQSMSTLNRPRTLVPRTTTQHRGVIVFLPGLSGHALPRLDFCSGNGGRMVTKSKALVSCVSKTAVGSQGLADCVHKNRPRLLTQSSTGFAGSGGEVPVWPTVLELAPTCAQQLFLRSCELRVHVGLANTRLSFSPVVPLPLEMS